MTQRDSGYNAGMRPIERRKSGATYADILALPREVNGEIVDGDLYVSPRPSSAHA